MAIYQPLLTGNKIPSIGLGTAAVSKKIKIKYVNLNSIILLCVCIMLSYYPRLYFKQNFNNG